MRIYIRLFTEELLSITQVDINANDKGKGVVNEDASITTYTANGIVSIRKAKHIISTFLPERIDFNVNDGVVAKLPFSPPIEFSCAVI